MTAKPSTNSASTNRRYRRGTAEIELLLSVFALVGILLLTLAAVRIALARLSTADESSLRAARYVATGEEAGDTEPFTPTTGYTNIRPGLPNRAFAPRNTQSVTITQGGENASTTITLKGTAAAIAPAWTYPADPTGGADYAANEQWFSNYIDESHGALIGPLQLAPAWPP